MYLKKLEIIGFKSFADKIFIDFDSGITAIVGPNGCGKTNIVDAVRWVIGEQKASVLRSSTMENVIFNGTNSRKPLGYAEVSLSIENTKEILPSEYSEIMITRRCFRDGTSNYLLNGVSCRLKDITALFMDTGMGADAYSVIELKMVNDILSHRTQDRRKLFEEAAGITKYKERRREALYKLEVARENIHDAQIEIRNRQRAVNAYERIAQKQQEAKEISDKLRSLEIDYHQRCLSKLIDDTRNVETVLRTRETEREELQAKLNKNESIIDSYKEDLSKTENKLNEARAALNNINSAINETQTSISIGEEKILLLRDNIERFSKEKVGLEKQTDKLINSQKSIEGEISVLKDTIKLLEDSLKDKKISLDATEERVKSSKEELKDLTQKHASISKESIEKKNEYELIVSRLEDQLSRCSRLTEENIGHINKVADLDREIEALENNLSERKNTISQQTLEYEEIKRNREDIIEEVSRLEKDIIYKSHEIEKLNDKVSFLINLLETFEDYSEGVRYLKKEKRETGAEVVIEKLEVPDKFKAAIEAALGEISNYLIVRDRSEAEKFIETLRTDMKGKVTFILKDTLYETTLNIFQDEFPEILSHEGVYGWADRFVKCPDEYLLLFKYLLDEYIIVENMETAMKLSSNNFIKYITLDGDIVTRGFLRAGSRTNIESLKIGRENLINDMKARKKELESSIGDDTQKLSELQDRLSLIDIDSRFNRIQEIRSVILECENKISQLNYLKAQTKSLIDNNTKETDELDSLNSELKSRIDSLIKEIEDAGNNKYQKEKELENFTTELENLADELTSKRDEYSNFNVEVTKVRGELTNQENELTRTLDNVSTIRNNILTRTAECTEHENEISRLTESMGRADENGEGAGLKHRLRTLESEKTGIESEFNLVKGEYDAKRSIVERIDGEQRELRNTRDEVISFIHQNEMQLTKDRIEIKEHKDRIKEEYEIDIVYTEYADADTYDFILTKAEIDRLRNKLRQLGGTGQMELAIYEQEKKELERLIEERDDLVKAEEDLINLIEQINKTAQEKFTETFELIRMNFQRIFRELFMEGDESDLKLVIDPDNPDPLEAKIDIIAKPRGKRPQLIDLLSGGEKTLTAIALLFAIYQVKPSPFCILDEVDAPLDDANIDRFIKIIRKFSEDTQFIIVTHNKRTMEAADSMYGVTMAEQGISTIVNVKFHDQPEFITANS